MLRCLRWFATVALAFAVALGPTAKSFGQTNSHRFEAKGTEFTINLPESWKPIDPDILEALVDPFADEDPAALGRAERYGYSPAPSFTLTNAPYIAVQVRHGRRVPDRILALQAKPDFRRRLFGEHLRRGGVPERNLMEASYDTNRHVARFSYTKMDPVIPEDELRVVQSIFYTEDGAVTVLAVCPSVVWKQWADPIEAAIASVRIADRLSYRPRTPGVAAGSASMTFEFLMVIGLIMGVGLMCIRYLRHGGGCDVMSDEI